MLSRLAGAESREYEIEGPITVHALKKMLKEDFPALTETLDGRSVLISVNEEFASNDTIINDGDEVGLLPPFSGG